MLTGEVGRPILGRGAKLAALHALAAEAGVRPEAALAVGDGANDSDMVRAAGLGVAYHAKPALAAVADARHRALRPDRAPGAAGHPRGRVARLIPLKGPVGDRNRLLPNVYSDLEWLESGWKGAGKWLATF